MANFRILLAAFVLVWGLSVSAASAQGLDGGDAEEAEDNGYFISLLEDQLSSDSRKIRLSGVDGLLSSRATVKRITISDPNGVWLQIDNASLDWNRRALLTGRVVVNELRAERIRVPRGPAPEKGLPEAKASGGFALPDLPVSVLLEKLEADRIEIGRELFGLAAVLKTSARIEMADGELDADLQMERLDGAGGTFALTAKVAGDPLEVAVDLDFKEPQGGIVATALGIEGQPPMEVALSAAGPITDLDGVVDLILDGEDLLDGQLKVVQGENGLSADFSLTGRLMPLLPPGVQPFFEGESTINASARQLADGGFALDRLAVQTNGLRLTGALSTASDGFPKALELSGTLGNQDGTRLILPVGAGDTSITDGRLRVTYGAGERWTGEIAVNDLRSGDLRVATMAVDMSGDAENLDNPAVRRLSGEIDGRASGFRSPDAGLNAALGEAVTLGISFDWRAGQPLVLKFAEIEGANSRLGMSGQVDGTEFTGRAALSVTDMRILGAVVGQDLAGALSVEVDGTVDPLTGILNLGVDGIAVDLGVGVAQVDPLLVGETRISGRVRRSTDGLFADDMALRNDQLEVTADGVYSLERTDFDFVARLDEIARITPEGQGTVSLIGRAEGQSGTLGIDLSARMEAGRLLDRDVTGLEATIKAVGESASDLKGTLGGSGMLGGAPLALSGAFQLTDGTQALRDLRVQLGRTTATGTVTRGFDGLFAGHLGIRSPDLSEPAALALLEADGDVDAEAMLYRSAGRQMLMLDASISQLDVAGVTVASALADLTVADVFGVPLLDGEVKAQDAVVAGYEVTELDVAAVTEGQAMRMDAAATLGNGAEADLGGLLTQLGGGALAIDLDALELRFKGERVSLTDPARVELRGSEVTLSPLQMAVAGGELTASGTVGEALDLKVALRALPLDVANAVVPDLKAGGVVTGSAEITGTPSQPAGTFALRAAGLTAAPAADLGIPPADVELDGRLGEGIIDLTGGVRLGTLAAARLAGQIPLSPDATGLNLNVAIERLALSLLDEVAGNQGLSGSVAGRATLTGALSRPEGRFSLFASDVTADMLRNASIGTVDLSLDGVVADQRAEVDGQLILSDGGQLTFGGVVPIDPGAGGLDLELTLGSFPLSVADQLAGRPGLAGTLSASAKVAGRLTEPEVDFVIAGRGLSLTALREEGIPSLDLNARGQYASGVLNLEQAQLAGPSGLSLSAEGQIPLSGPGLDIRADGSIPLALADIALARSQSQLRGQMTLSGRAGGSLAAPDLNGRLSISGGTFVNAPANLRFNDISLDATVSGTRLNIASLRANAAQGGTIVASGSVDLDPAAGLPANLDITFREVFYTDGQVVSVLITGDVGIDGPILGNGQVTGRIVLERTEISLRGGFGISAGVLLDVEHRNPPRDVVLTLDRARIEELREEENGDGGLALGLDLEIVVPNKLFIRGRGVDAELGGRIRVGGTLNDVRPTGNIELVRGRLSILGQRIEFDSGQVTLIGDLDPQIDLVAETEAADGTVIFVAVRGLATNPEISFSSVPELPDDEVLAQLIFNRNVSELSPFQVAQLAAAVATLAGGGDGVVGGFRSAVGLADLDITTGEDGTVGVRAGAYLSDNIYLDVETDGAGDSEATVNIDFSRFFKGKLTVDNRGESSVGVFFEKDY